MKTKTKTFALLRIAIVLCSILLLSTLPAIAADQTDEPLEIYGNANKDDTIDMRDVTYIKLVIFGKKPVTTFADANYDGKVSMLDLGQTKLIILDKEKKLTIIDMNDRTVTVSKPIEGVIVTHREQFEQLRSLKVPKDIILTAERQILTMDEYTIYFAEYQDLPDVGSCSNPNLEAIVGLRPDAILIGSYGQNATQHTAALEVFESAGISAIYAHETETNFVENIRMLGYLFGKKDEADEYLDWREGLLNLIGERVEDIPEEDKPKVYIEWGGQYTTINEAGTRIAAMGGQDIFEGEVSGDINPEEVAKQNPDIIVIIGGRGSGYITDNVTELKELREELMSREELQDVPAVKTGKVYVMSYYITGTGCCHGGRDFVQEAYLAKWFNPTYFDDFDPKAIHQEYLTRFQGLDWDLDKHGVYVYHPEEHPDGN
jgi:iron complex transport system substrate-binding protein